MAAPTLVIDGGVSIASVSKTLTYTPKNMVFGGVKEIVVMMFKSMFVLKLSI